MGPILSTYRYLSIEDGLLAGWANTPSEGAVGISLEPQEKKKLEQPGPLISKDG